MSSENKFWIHDHLTDDGIMVVNMNMRSTEEGNINQYLSDTISSVFGDVYTVDVPNNTNRELYLAYCKISKG